MNAPCANLTVLVGQRFACVKIAGRANFHASVNFKTLLNELQHQGYPYLVLELSECALMDSTFLGVLAGFGLKANAPAGRLCHARHRVAQRQRTVDRTAGKPGRAASVPDHARGLAGRRAGDHRSAGDLRARRARNSRAPRWKRIKR